MTIMPTAKARRLFFVATLVAGLALAAWPISPARAAAITVNTPADELNADGD